MATVTFSDDDFPGSRLLKHEQELRIQHPHLSAAHARALVADQHPDLVQLHHEGHHSIEPPAPTVDPSIALNARVHELLKSREALNRSQAYEIACRQLPEHAEAYRSGLRMPATTATREHAEQHVTRRTSDASVELLRLTQERMASHGETVTVARRAVLEADPQLARCYNQAKPLPMVTPRPVSKTVVEEALVSVQRLRRELAQLTAPAERHYRDLSAEERAKEMPHVRRFSQGDKIAAPMLFDGSGGI